MAPQRSSAILSVVRCPWDLFPRDKGQGTTDHGPRTNGVVDGDEMREVPAMTDFRAVGTIMGPAGLTAVFGMGTGRTPPVWSPGKRPAGVGDRAGHTWELNRT